MPIEIKEMIIKTTVTSSSDSVVNHREAPQLDRVEMRQEIKKICLELIKDFFEKKKLR